MTPQQRNLHKGQVVVPGSPLTIFTYGGGEVSIALGLTRDQVKQVAKRIIPIFIVPEPKLLRAKMVLLLAHSPVPPRSSIIPTYLTICKLRGLALEETMPLAIGLTDDQIESILKGGLETYDHEGDPRLFNGFQFTGAMMCIASVPKEIDKIVDRHLKLET